LGKRGRSLDAQVRRRLYRMDMTRKARSQQCENKYCAFRRRLKIVSKLLFVRIVEGKRHCELFGFEGCAG